MALRELKSCEGPCKRSFHATEEDGRESKCRTLGYTSTEVKRIGTYLCPNCKNKQHQCFRCGELEPSHGPNAKVFQCNKASCGYFYHSKCIAQLLDPNATDGCCELERRIMAGMSFRCPIHWCFKCGHMENKTQRALRLAVCRRCPRAYHMKCFPREISLQRKDKDCNQRAWMLSKKNFIYCLDHEIDKDTDAPSRNHIRFPATPECTKTEELGNSKGRMSGKRRKNTGQSTKPTEFLSRSDHEIDKDTGAPSRSHIKFPATPECTKTKELGNSKGRMSGKRRKNTDQSTKPTEFLSRSDHEIDKDTGAPSRNHIKFPATPECTKTEELGNIKGRMYGKRRKNTDQSTKPTEFSARCGAESELADNVGAKSTLPQIVVQPHCAAKRLKGDPRIEQSTIGVGASQNGAETTKGNEKQFGVSSCAASTEAEKRVTCLPQNETCLGTPYDGPSTKGMSDCSVQDTPVDKDAELDNVARRITEDKYANGREKTQEDYTTKETAYRKDSNENQGQNNVLELDNLWVVQADGCPLEPGNKGDKERQENAYGLGSASGQEKETSSRETPDSDRGMAIECRKGETTLDNVDNHSSVKQGSGSYPCQDEWSPKCNDCLVAIDQDTSNDRSQKGSQTVEKESDGKKTDLDKNKKHTLREDGREAHYEDGRAGRNTAADTSTYKCRDNTQSDRREEPVGRDTEQSPEMHRIDRGGDSYPGTSNRQRCEWLQSGNSSRSVCDDRRQLSPCQSAFPLAEFGGDRSHLYLRDSQHRTDARHDLNIGIQQQTHSAGCYQLGGYGEGSGHVSRNLSNWRSRTSRPVTDKYAPQLERTNDPPRSQSYLQYNLRLV